MSPDTMQETKGFASTMPMASTLVADDEEVMS